MKINQKMLQKKSKSLIFLLLFLIVPLIISTPLFIPLYNKSSPENEEENNFNKQNLTPKLGAPPNAHYFASYKTITINHSKVVGSGVLTDFPILISILDTDLHDDVQPDGDDIAFSIENIWVDHEIELFNQTYSATEAELVVWVRIPALSGSVDTDLRMYYGNSSMSSRQNPTGVWDSNYASVWHLKESGSGVVDEFKDSTSNSNDGIGGSGTPSYIPTQTSGNISYGQNFDGVNDHINVPHSTSLSITGDAITLEAWVYYAPSSYNMGILSKDGYNGGYRFLVSTGGNIILQLTGSSYTLWSSGTINSGSWHHIVARYDGSLMSVYIDGIKDGTETSRTGGVDSTTDPVWIGHGDNAIGETWSYPFHGKIDEVRISNVDRSVNWIKTEYSNQNDPDSFYTVGIEQDVVWEPPNAHYFMFYKIIIIDHNQVSGTGDHYNFPVLISLIDEDMKNHTQPDGDDIAFAAGGDWLDHEIELYNQTYSSIEAQLIAWVRIPYLLTSKDTSITLYYGNSTMDSRQNPTGIWDVNTLGVWHLSEEGNGSPDEYKDSSKYSNHGQGGEGNSSFIPTRTSGKIGFAQDFNNLDGEYDLIDCGNNSVFDITGNQITLQAWIKHNITPQAHYYGIMNHKGWYDGYSLWIEQLSLKLAFNLPGDSYRIVTDTDITTNTWHHVVATYNGSYMSVYIDGVQDPNTLAKTNNIEPSSSEKDFWIGHGDQPKDKIWSGEYEGQIDEVRISTFALSADWIATEYANQNDPSSFYSVGDEQVVSEKPLKADFFNYANLIS